MLKFPQLKLPWFQTNNYNIERILPIKFLGVLLDGNILWKDQIKLPETKFLKMQQYYVKAKGHLSKESLLSLYHAYIHTYIINYGKLAWASTIRTKLKKIHSQQKHSIRIFIKIYFHTLNNFLYRTKFLMYTN